MAKLNKKELEWFEVRQRFNLTHAQVQMARELELVPRLLAKLTELPDIQQLYLERFGRQAPKTVVSIEERAKQEQKEKAMEKLHPPKPAPKPAAPAPKPRKKNRPHVSIPPRGSSGR